MKNVLKACSLCSCAVPPPAASPLYAPGTSGSTQFPPPHTLLSLDPIILVGDGSQVLYRPPAPAEAKSNSERAKVDCSLLGISGQDKAVATTAHCAVTQQGPLAHLQCRHPASLWLQSLSVCPSTCGLGGGPQEGRLIPHPQQGPCILHWTYKLQSQLCMYNSVSSGHREKGMLSGDGLMWTP